MSEKGTEQASPQRKQKARSQGDIARSRELLSAAAMLGGVVTLGITAHTFVESWSRVFLESLRDATLKDASEQIWSSALQHMLRPVLLPIGMILSAAFCGALSVGVAQGGGLSIHLNAIAFKFNRLNPISNLSNLFSLRSTMRVVKSLVPAAVMVALGWSALRALTEPMAAMSLLRLPTAFATAYDLALDAAWITLVWSALDYAMEWRSLNQRLKMSKQELRDELRDAMGNPQIKARVRQVQMAISKRKVKADMRRASVVITNPTHYAVALEFNFDTMAAPTVLAKGRDLHAADIREEARWLGIPLVENPPLARSLYRSVEPGQSIPFELYATVAGILAYLYRQKVEERRRQEQQSQSLRRLSQQPFESSTSILGFGPSYPNFQGGL